MSLALISRYGSVGGNGYVVEYAGSAIAALEVEARLTLCNMATEFSAVSGIIAPDDRTYYILRAGSSLPRARPGMRHSRPGGGCPRTTTRVLIASCISMPVSLRP